MTVMVIDGGMRDGRFRMIEPGAEWAVVFRYR
jgi:hypothetical protein